MRVELEIPPGILDRRRHVGIAGQMKNQIEASRGQHRPEIIADHIERPQLHTVAN